jgi:peptide-methionine (S)-S-oxide reductase
MDKAIFAGGCFWCTEAVFKRLKGVGKVTSGYANGEMANPTYGDVSSGETGFAEAVEIQFDPEIISYDKLLEIFWATHDPTSLNRQGADVGTQYRSAIYYLNDEQKEKAEVSKQNVERSVTEIAPLKNFYTAEEYHQNYFEKNTNSNPYCSIVIAPKIKKLLDKFNAEVKPEYQT